MRLPALIHSAPVRALTTVALLVGACLAPAAPAAVRDYYFAQAQGTHGLAQNTVTAFAQDRDGFIWIGTQAGLHRFDGQDYTLYQQREGDPHSLPDNYVTALARDDAGDVWVGTYSQYAARMDPRSGRMQRYAPRTSGHPEDHVYALLPSAAAVWVGTGHGLERLDPRTGRRTLVLPLPAASLSDQPQGLVHDQRGMLWYATAAGLYRLPADGSTGVATRIGHETGLHTLLRDRSDRMWVGGQDGLFLLQNRDSLLRAWPRAGAQEAASLHAVAAAPDGHLWLAVDGDGLRRFDPRSGAVVALHANPLLPGSLPEDQVNAMLVDQAGLLWVGGQYHGAAVADSAGARFRFLVDLQPPSPGQPAVDSSIRAIFQDSGRRLWLAADDGRLLRFDRRRGFEDLSALLPPANGSGQRVMAFADPGNGHPWVATTTGLFRLDPDVPGLQPVDIPGVPSPRLRSLDVAADGTVWLGTDKAGAIAFQPLTGTVRRLPYLRGDARGLLHPQVHAVLAARDGRIWIGTGHGLTVFDPRNGQLRHFRKGSPDAQGLAGNLIRALWQDSRGDIWVGSHSGLNRVHLDGQERFQVSRPLQASLDGDPSPVIYSIVGDADGDLWLGTNRGLMRYEPAPVRAAGADAPGSGQLRRYGLADGLQALEFNGGAVAALGDGRLAFGGINGTNVFDPARIHDSQAQPPLRLLSARLGGGAHSTADDAWRGGAIEMPESASLLRLRIGSLDYLGSTGVRYRYRIDGLDPDWIDNGARGDISYTLLPAGRYLFRAQSTNRDGVWGTRELRLPIVVTPPPWRSPPALAAYALLVAVALWLAWAVRARRRRHERDVFERIRDREERLKLALWASGEQFWDYDLRSGAMQRMRVDDDAIRSAADIQVETAFESRHTIHGEDLPQVRERVRQHLRGAAPTFESEHRVPGDNGKWMWVHARGRVVERDADGRPRRLAGTARDVTRSRHAERERRIASEVLRSMSEAVSVLDLDFSFISVNPAFTRMTGYADTEVLGRSASLLDSSQHDPEFYRAMRQEMERTGHWSGEMWQQRKDGEEFLCAIESSVILDANGKRSLYVAVLTDITDQKRAEQELRYLANYDTLTNLPNRTLLAERLSRAIVRARRQDDRIAVLFLDLDRFKDINDSLGHAAGDRILRAAAVRIQDTVGPQHTVARLSGDEFTVLLENLESADQADKIAREIITAFEAPLQVDDRREISISPSIGISLYPDHAQVPTELLKQADTAMYQAKAAGRRTYMRYSDSMDVTIRHRATVSGALRKVLDRNELRLVYQPRLALGESRIIGVEALLRWHSEEHGEIPPSEFIPLAEESGLILEIGEWVLREACLTLARWHQHGLEGLGISVNVSALQLLRGDLPGVLQRVLDETGVPPSSLELELTESVIMANAQQTADKLRAFRAIGVTLAIDDFGTGYSSLAYLKRLPINTLKIDKEFVDDLSQGSEDAAITTTVITMAHSLGLNVVAEGVETEDQLAFLRAHGCDEIQGYWLSPPLEAQRCLAFIRNWTPPPATAGTSAATRATRPVS